ncbi:hypothetical protein GS399_16395 [Pedobacter sp. HMF7647]|uniref:L-lactate permease n=1 Tax=Hufsiella arboris TaxID=2695275 RepID=A0A7K1YD85_9SPHI|nr:L-lactate permease [Hufsiella arboris]MXV52556.1 hypothetical protein [Hufsiella arboris]
MAVILGLLFLLFGTFVLKSIRIGASAGIVIQILFALLNNSWSAVQTNALLNGLIISVELSLLLFGAITFYEFLKLNNRLEFLYRFVNTSPSRPFLLISFCFFLGSFFEGIAGFGIPAMLLIPLLVNAGFKPLTAIVCGLCGSFMAVCFGALGTPMIFGMNITQPGPTVTLVLLLYSPVTVLLPFLLTWLYGKIESVDVNWRKEVIKLFGAGLIYFGIFFVTSRFTVEYPSVFAGSVGMIVFMIVFNANARLYGFMFWIKSFGPYLCLVVLLLLGKPLLNQYAIVFSPSLRTISIYQPGLFFLMAILFITLYFHVAGKQYTLIDAYKISAKRVPATALTILMIVAFSQLIREELLQILGNFLKEQTLVVKPFFYLLAGTAGAFITGSATMSNLLLHGLLAAAGSYMTLYSAMLISGSAVGNVISLQNIVMAKSVLVNPPSERIVLKFNAVVLIASLCCIALLVFFCRDLSM